MCITFYVLKYLSNSILCLSLHIQSTTVATTTQQATTTQATTAGPVLCAENQYVSSNTCVNCPDFSTNPAGDPVLGSDTTCACEANRFVQNNQCVSCTEGGDTNAAGDPVPGPNTSCDRFAIAGSSCTLFEGATGAVDDPFSTGCTSGMSTDCCQGGDSCKNGFNGCSAGIASNDACQAALGALCTGLTPQCCKTANSGPYACQASGASCPQVQRSISGLRYRVYVGYTLGIYCGCVLHTVCVYFGYVLDLFWIYFL